MRKFSPLWWISAVFPLFLSHFNVSTLKTKDYIRLHSLSKKLFIDLSFPKQSGSVWKVVAVAATAAVMRLWYLAMSFLFKLKKYFMQNKKLIVITHINSKYVWRKLTCSALKNCFNSVVFYSFQAKATGLIS